jgi:predicted negative regulator of RcsB-dependent stress response
MHLGRDTLLRFLDDTDIRHLTDCRQCRARLAELYLDSTVPGILPRPGEGENEDGLDYLLRLSISVLGQRTQALDTDRDQARPLLNQLLAITEGSIEAVLEADSRFHSAGLVQLLLDAAVEAADPNEALRLARLSLLVLDQLPESPYLSPLRVLGHCRLAEARRQRGELGSAEELFREAASQLVDESLSLHVRITFSRLLGLLRADQRRVDEALALLGRAEILAEQAGTTLEMGLSLLSQGWLLFGEYEHHPAVLVFRQARHLLSDAKADLLFAALSGLALASAELGHNAQLEEALRDIRPVVPQVADGKLRLRLLHARLARIAGDTQEATKRLQALFEAHINRSRPTDAALVALELVQLHLEKPQPEAETVILKLRDALRPSAAIGALPEHIWRVTSFALAVASQRTGAYNDVLDSALSFLSRARFNPELEFFPLPEPEEDLTWDQVPPSLQAKVLEAAGLPTGPKTSRDWQYLAWNCETLTGIRLRPSL